MKEHDHDRLNDTTSHRKSPSHRNETLWLKSRSSGDAPNLFMVNAFLREPEQI